MCTRVHRGLHYRMFQKSYVYTTLAYGHRGYVVVPVGLADNNGGSPMSDLRRIARSLR